ncbi:MAG: hypothetical protein JXR70_15140 [Spirochaetales bacterium]|nr:hypothetical protein [Spirochaetales bacterium]
MTKIKGVKIKAFYLIFSLILSSSILWPQGNDLLLKGQIDWQKGILELNISRAFEMSQSFKPHSRFLFESQVNTRMMDFFLATVLDLNIDSSHKAIDIIRNKPGIVEKLKEIAALAQKGYSYYSSNMTMLHIQYQYQLVGENSLLNCFISHENTAVLDKTLGFIPERLFSGIVIYAQGKYPHWGEKYDSSFKPVMFPKIYNEEMDLLLDPKMCKPEFLEKWGMVAYTSDFNEIPFTLRIGTYPLRTMARGVFGKTPSDILIPTEDGRRILSNPDNFRLLQEGRILIIIDNVVE